MVYKFRDFTSWPGFLDAFKFLKCVILKTDFIYTLTSYKVQIKTEFLRMYLLTDIQSFQILYISLIQFYKYFHYFYTFCFSIKLFYTLLS
jgi:hypothetical protein